MWIVIRMDDSQRGKLRMCDLLSQKSRLNIESISFSFSPALTLWPQWLFSCIVGTM